MEKDKDTEGVKLFNLQDFLSRFAKIRVIHSYSGDNDYVIFCLGHNLGKD